MANIRILSNVEKEFMKSALDLGLRVDGRQIDTVREMKIDFGIKSGTVEVSLGKTKVLARVVHELGTPRPDKPNAGIITINCTFPKYYQTTVTKNDIDRICLIIKNGIYESNAIDLESLCVLNAEKVWLLNCNICVIQHDGNIIDCANLAVLSALKHHRRPDVTVIGSKITIHSMSDHHPVPLTIFHLPICVSLGHVLIDDNDINNPNPNPNQKRNKNGFYTFVDPNYKEEKLMDGKTVYCMTKKNQLCAVDKLGGVPMSAKTFLSYIDEYVSDIVKKWSNQIINKFIKYQYLENDLKQRHLRITQKVINPIDIFGFATNDDDKDDNDDNVMDDNPLVDMKIDVDDDDNDDLVMIDNNLDQNNDTDKIWNDWQINEQNKLKTIQSNLIQSMKEKRINANKSVLVSEFD